MLVYMACAETWSHVDDVCSLCCNRGPCWFQWYSSAGGHRVTIRGRVDCTAAEGHDCNLKPRAVLMVCTVTGDHADGLWSMLTPKAKWMSIYNLLLLTVKHKEASFAVVWTCRLTIENGRREGLWHVTTSPLSSITPKRNSLDRKPLKRILKNCYRDAEV